MTAYGFPTQGMARRFTRNARGRGYVVKVAGCVATIVSEADAQLRLLVRAYVGLKVKDDDKQTTCDDAATN